MDNWLQNIIISKELYEKVFESVCRKYHVTFTEMVILMFLANHPEMNTATDFVEKHHGTKSTVSMAGRALQERGFITGEFTDGNHRTIHLKLSDSANEIIQEGRMAEQKLMEIMTYGFSENEKNELQNYLLRVSQNIHEYHKYMKQMQKQK